MRRLCGRCRKKRPSRLFNSQNYAVMMGTPADFEDFAIGFAIAEGIVARAADLSSVLVLPSEQGFAVDLAVPEDKLNRGRMAKRSLEGRLAAASAGSRTSRTRSACRAMTYPMCPCIHRPWPGPMRCSPSTNR